MADSAQADSNTNPQAEIARLKQQLEACEAEHARLTYELGHRVKNTLSVVQALASQTMRTAATKEEGLEAFGHHKRLPNAVTLRRANGDVLEVGVLGTQPARRRNRLAERRVDAPIGANRLRESFDDLPKFGRIPVREQRL